MDFKDGFTSGRKEITVVYQGKNTVFYANELSYFTTQTVALQADKEQKVFVALLVAESITDKAGNKFTYDEVMRLKKDYAKAFFTAVAEINNLGGETKN